MAASEVLGENVPASSDRRHVHYVICSARAERFLAFFGYQAGALQSLRSTCYHFRGVGMGLLGLTMMEIFVFGD